MIWVILLLGLSLRLISLDQSLWLDEAINVLATQKFSLLGMITDYARADFHPPGYFILLWIWTKIFGISEVVVRIPSVIFGVLTIYIVYLLGQKIHSKILGLFSAFLLAINPLHIYYSQEARMYALAALAVSVNFLFLIKLVKGEKYNIFFLILSNTLVLASDYLAYFIFPAQLIFLVILKQKEAVKKWTTALLIAGLVWIWWIPVFLNQLDVGAVAAANLPAWKFIVGGFDLKAIPLTLVKFIIGRISLMDKLIYGALLLPISMLFLFLIFRGIRFVANIWRNLLITWLVIPIIIAVLISFMIPIYSYFRLQFVLPAFLILVALGIISFKSKLRYGFLISVVCIQLFSTLVYLFNPSFHREDWRGLVNFLKTKDALVLSRSDKLVLFESSGTLPPFDYYAKDSLNAKGALKTFPAKDENDVADLELGNSDVYLVDYLVEISDPKKLAAKKLDNLGYKETDIKNFTGVGFVYHYVKK